MTKTLTEQWRDGKLQDGAYYILVDKYEQNEPEIDVGVCYNSNFEWWIVKEVLAPVPTYDKYKEMSQKIERLEFDNEALEMAHNEGKEINAELVSKTDKLVQKIHILNEQNTKQYNELCEEIKKNNILEKQLEIATKALEYYAQCRHLNLDIFAMLLDKHKNEFADFEVYEDGETARKALKEMEGVK